MAFNSTHTTEHGYLNYPTSDSDDQLRHYSPRVIEAMDAENLSQALSRNISRGSFSSETPNAMSIERPFPPSSYSQLKEEENTIDYVKYDDNEIYHRSQSIYNDCREYDLDGRYCADNELHREASIYDLSQQKVDEMRRKMSDDCMQIEEEGFSVSDYRPEDSTELGCDSTSMYTDSDLSKRYQDLHSQYSVETPGMYKESTIFTDITAMSTMTQNSQQDLRMSIRRNAVRLRDLIECILQGRKLQVPDLQNLNEIERTVLSCIIEKKSNLSGAKNSKRREEKQKLFFKSALKFIESSFLAEFAKQRNLSRKKDVDPMMFYLAYFQEVAASMQIDVSNFLPPNQKRKSKSGSNRNELKSFNLKYIELILSSKRFLYETIEYLENSFAQSYAKSRYQKIDKVVENIADVVDQMYRDFSRDYGNNPLGLRDIVLRRVTEVLQSSKSKLPWSNAELEEAKEFARVTIRKISENSLKN